MSGGAGSSAYNKFAWFYDKLQSEVDYDGICSLIDGFIKKYSAENEVIVDLACGTGSLTTELALKGIDVYGIDASAEMLSEAMQKSSEKGLNILYLKQKMQNLNLYGTIDTCICTLDSINHITKEEDVTKAFERVAFFMDKDGLFVFDVNTVYKHEQVLANNTFVYETDKVFCVWQNTLRENCVTDIDLDFFEEENGIYYRTSESFSERGYSRKKLTEMLVNAGFELEAVYGDMSFDEPKADEQRLVFVARMKNPINKEC